MMDYSIEDVHTDERRRRGRGGENKIEVLLGQIQTK